MVSLSPLRAYALLPDPLPAAVAAFPSLRNHLSVMRVLKGALHCARSLSVPIHSTDRVRERQLPHPRNWSVRRAVRPSTEGELSECASIQAANYVMAPSPLGGLN